MKKKKEKRKIKVGDVIRCIILFIAIGILLYPTISNYLYEKNSSRVVENYDQKTKSLSKKEKEKLLNMARAYNKNLAEDQAFIEDAFSDEIEESKEYTDILNATPHGTMGYISIPKINVRLPIYHGTSEKVLQVGVGHLKGTSFPVGGKDTHAVLTGHRGLPSKLLFTDLDQMKKGNVFYLKVLDEKMAYKVDQILTVLPSETESLEIEKGKDYVTLLTCTPYGINSHRLLVRGHRIPYKEALLSEPDKIETKIKIPFEVKVLLIGLGVLVLIGILGAVLRKRKRKGDKRKHARRRKKE